MLSQTDVDAKTNEHKGAFELLKTLIREGRVIVADAIFCQKDFCRHIHGRGGHYFVAVKDNQPQLKRDIAAAALVAWAVENRKWLALGVPNSADGSTDQPWIQMGARVIPCRILLDWALLIVVEPIIVSDVVGRHERRANNHGQCIFEVQKCRNHVTKSHDGRFSRRRRRLPLPR